MSRAAVIKKIKAEAKRQGKRFQVVELTKHSGGIVVDGKRSTLGRHSEIDEVIVGKFFDQFAGVLGKGW
jgi:hypothetical protein